MFLLPYLLIRDFALLNSLWALSSFLQSLKNQALISFLLQNILLFDFIYIIYKNL